MQLLIDPAPRKLIINEQDNSASISLTTARAEDSWLLGFTRGARFPDELIETPPSFFIQKKSGIGLIEYRNLENGYYYFEGTREYFSVSNGAVQIYANKAEFLADLWDSDLETVARAARANENQDLRRWIFRERAERGLVIALLVSLLGTALYAVADSRYQPGIQHENTPMQNGQK